MNLFFRLLMILVKSLSTKKRFGIWGLSTIDSRVGLTDTDETGALSHLRYFSFADLGAIDFLVRSGILAALRANGRSPIIVGKTIKHLEPLPRGAKFMFTTRLLGWSGHYSCLKHEILHDGRPVAEGLTIGRFVSIKTAQHPTVEDVAISMGIEDPQTDVLPEPIMHIIDELRNRQTAKSVQLS